MSSMRKVVVLCAKEYINRNYSEGGLIQVRRKYQHMTKVANHWIVANTSKNKILQVVSDFFWQRTLFKKRENFSLMRFTIGNDIYKKNTKW